MTTTIGSHSLPAGGTAQYGDVVFGTLFHSNVTSTPIWDEAGRTIVAVEHEIYLSGHVQSDSGIDTTMATVHQQLEAPGLALTYTSKGWGTLQVNTAGGTAKDVDYGPKPKVLSFTPEGDKQAALVEWRCSTRVPYCADSGKYEKAIMAWNYDWQHTVDGNGMSKIMVSGYLEVPASRPTGTRDIPDVADFYREKLASDVPLGFRREPGTYKLTKNRRRLDFSWVDSELPYPLPDGCTYASVRHRVRWNRGKDAYYIFATISGSLTVAPDKPVAHAFEKWKVIVNSRVHQSRDRINGLVVAVQNEKPAVFIDSLEIDEEMFGRTVDFVTTYRIIGAPIHRLIEFTGLFTRVEGITFERWKTSMAETAHHIRGSAKIKFDPKMDAIIDLCLASSSTSTLTAGTSSLSTLGQAILRPGNLRPAGQAILRPIQILGANANRLINPASSWIAYRCNIRFVEDESIVRLKPLPVAASEVVVAPPPNQPSNPAAAALAQDHPPAAASSPVPDILQRRSSPTPMVRMTGRALRLAHRVPTPHLETVGGVRATLAHQVIDEGVASAVGGIPIHYKTWDLFYELPSAPRSLPVIANPALDTAGVA